MQHATKYDGTRKILAMAAIIVAAVALSGCAGIGRNAGSFEEMAYPERSGGPELTAEQHERLGDDLHERNSPEMAYVHYARALAGLGSDHDRAATLQVKKGLVIFSQGHDEAALKEFQAVLAEHPDHALANEAAGAVYLKAGLTREARSHFEHAAAVDPGLWRTQQYLGMLASRDGRYDEAVARFAASLELRPGQAETLNNLGVAHLMNGEYGHALAAFREALAAGAPQDKTYNNIGLALARMGRTQEALQTFGFAGDEAKAHNNLGYVLMLQGDARGAVEHFERAIELSPSYYGKAFANLKQARLALSFQQAGDAAAPAAAMPSRAVPSSPVPSSTVPAPTVSAPTGPVPARSDSETGDALPAATSLVGPPLPSPVSSLHYRPFQQQPAGNRLNLRLASASADAGANAATTPAFGIHVASFRKMDRTERYVRQLDGMGVEAAVMTVDIEGLGRWHRVLAGPYPTSDTAAAARPGLLQALKLDSAPIIQFKDADHHTPPQSEGPALL